MLSLSVVENIRWNRVNLLNQACLCLLAHEKGQEFDCQIHKAREVGSDLRVESSEVNFSWPCETDRTLNSSIQKDTVEIGIGVCDAR